MQLAHNRLLCKLLTMIGKWSRVDGNNCSRQMVGRISANKHRLEQIHMFKLHYLAIVSR
jgi:hypothetical protein